MKVSLQASALSAILSVAALPIFAVELQHATVEERAVTAGLAHAVKSGTPPRGNIRWITWDVPTNDPGAVMCCFDSVEQMRRSSSTVGSCSLKRSGSCFNIGDSGDHGPRPAGDTFSLFLELDGDQPVDLRMFSAGCRIDGEGASVLKLAGVSAEESVSYLASLAWTFSRTDRAVHRDKGDAKVIAAIAMHRAANTVDTLDSLIHSAPDAELRDQAAFWLGMKGGARGREILRHAIDEVASSGFRDQAIAGIAQDKDPAAIDLLIRLARSHPSPAVRRQAIFWLGQRAGEKATAALAKGTDDHDDDVKEMAVFSISQLPKEQAIPELIRLARTHSSMTVRERAIFWLGQSGDPRALDFIEEVLRR